jgi:hypothetical protein
MQGCDRLNIDASLVGWKQNPLDKPRPLEQRLSLNDQMKTVEPGHEAITGELVEI